MFDVLMYIALQAFIIAAWVFVVRKYRKSSFKPELNRVRWSKSNLLRLLPAAPLLLVPLFLHTKNLSCTIGTNTCSDSIYVTIMIFKYMSIFLGSMLVAALHKVEQVGLRFWWVKVKLLLITGGLFSYILFMVDFVREF